MLTLRNHRYMISLSVVFACTAVADPIHSDDAFIDPPSLYDSSRVALVEALASQSELTRQYTLIHPAVIRNYDLAAHTLLAEPGQFVSALVFFDAERPEPAVVREHLASETTTGILVMLAITILLATRQTAPVNLRTVHSCLRARRDHAPTR